MNSGETDQRNIPSNEENWCYPMKTLPKCCYRIPWEDRSYWSTEIYTCRQRIERLREQQDNDEEYDE